ncbi:MAG TPA: DUF3037 domain-containing protein [Candidatus Angelobacter sp.]|nr:DUF3037 domain-containing protein [Candidatus Angelobacter sp.]
MNQLEKCNFFLLRYVPDAVKNEFVNIGLVLLPPAGNPEVRFARDLSRVHCLDPQADLEVLEAFESDLRSKLHEANGDREFILRKIRDSFSNALQPSEFKACVAESAAQEADALARLYLEPAQHPRERREAGGRQAILDQMHRDFEAAGVWRLMRRQIAVADYAGTRDPLKIDCGYASNGSIKLFHALAIGNDMSSVNSAKVLAFSFPALADGIRRGENKQAQLTAIVEDNLARGEELIGFALETLQRQQIQVSPIAQMGSIAAQAAQELRVR